MSSVTFPVSLGGNGTTYSDTDMLNNGHETRFIPMLAQEVIMAQSAAASAVSASASKDNAALSATSADASKTAAAASAAAALSVAAQNLTAISTTQTGTIIAQFVYPTAKDADGGLACSKAGLPGLMGIEATSTTVTIYNVTDIATQQIAQITGLTSVTSVLALHGRLYVGHASGLSVYDMLNSFALLTTYSTSSTPAIVANTVQCITATVLPAAPIDNATGLPVPTVWVGTLGGVSRIADDGTVSNWTDNSGSAAHLVYNIAVSGDYVWWSTDNSYQGKVLHTRLVTATLAAGNYGDTSVRHYGSDVSVVWSSPVTPIWYGGILSVTQDITRNAIATNRSLTLLQPNTTDWGKGLHATITTNSNSGMQWGDIRGAWLCQGTAETLTATDLVTGDSSTFTAGVGSWVGYSSTLSVSSGALSVAASATYGSAAIALTTVAGKTYTVSVDSKTSAGGTATEIFSGTSANNANLSPVIAGTTGTTFVTSTFSFIATGTTTYLTMRCTVASTVLFDNVTVKLAEPDVSYNNRALTVVGSIVKSAVNTGCDLMGYSGWSASNYKMMPYNSAYDFGTADFHTSFWIYKTALSAGYTFLIDRKTSANANNAIRVYIPSGSVSTIALQTYDGAGVASTATSTSSLALNVWNKVDMVRLSTGNILIYINGVLDSNTAATVRSVTSAVNALYVGIDVGLSGPAANEKLALLHLSAGAPTAAQIKSAYEKEKLMFVAGTKCLLPGTSNDVKSIDYDDSTDTQHYETGEYYGAHKGLVRVDSAAGVYTSISAKNGAIIKGA